MEGFLCSRDEEICLAFRVADKLEVAAINADGVDIFLLCDVK